MEDGGYYAIKGFDFQIDKTILSLFRDNGPDVQVAIEQIQDINTNETVIQVKYKETQEFSNSKIRDPIVKLIDEFQADTTGKRYVLYCYFKYQVASSMSFLPSGIDDILKISLGKTPSKNHKYNFDKIKNITPLIRANFSKKFTLQFADEYDAHFSDVLKLIGSQSFCGSDSEALFLYHVIADHLRKIVISNPDPTKRFCDRRTIISLMENGKRAIFHSTFTQLKSRTAYLNFLKSKAPRFLPNQSNCILIGSPSEKNSTTKISDLIKTFLNSYFKNATCDVNPPMFLVSTQKRSCKVSCLEASN